MIRPGLLHHSHQHCSRPLANGCLQAGARDEALVARIADLPKLAEQGKAAGYKEAAVLSKFAKLAKSICDNC